VRHQLRWTVRHGGRSLPALEHDREIRREVADEEEPVVLGAAEARGAPIRLAKTGRGRFRLDVQVALRLEQVGA
jgi:hypothetical protein